MNNSAQKFYDRHYVKYMDSDSRRLVVNPLVPNFSSTYGGGATGHTNKIDNFNRIYSQLDKLRGSSEFKKKDFQDKEIIDLKENFPAQCIFFEIKVQLKYLQVLRIY